MAGSKEPSGEEFCTPKYHCGVSTPRAFTTSGSLDEDSWLPRSSHFDPVQEGDPVSSQRHQFVQDPGPITGAQFFNWQQHPDEQTEEHTASYTSELASFDVAGITGTAAAGPETRVAPRPGGSGVKSTALMSRRRARHSRGRSGVRSGSWWQPLHGTALSSSSVDGPDMLPDTPGLCTTARGWLEPDCGQERS